MARNSPEVTAALAKATRGGSRATMWIGPIWVAVPSVLVLAGPHSSHLLRSFGGAGLVCAVLALGAVSQSRSAISDRHAKPEQQQSLRSTLRSKRARAKAIERADALAPLSTLDETAARKVADALDLIDGPLHEHLDDSELNDTASAIRRSLASLRQLNSTQERTEDAVAVLGAQLTAAGVVPKTDAQWKTASDAASALRQRVGQTTAELRTSAEQIIAAWAAIKVRDAEQAATRNLSAARNEVADATTLALQTQSTGGGISDAASSRAELTDAVDAVRSRLGALDELEDLSDKLAPLRNEVPDLTDPELLPTTRPQTSRRNRGTR
jgi:hypothetical protein